jgi:signal recognition particle subunit SRP54
MGGLSAIVSAMPGGDQMVREGRVDEKELDRIEAIVNSMTPQERRKPNIINGERRQRIAKGAGVEVFQVNQLLKKFNDTRKMMKKVTTQMQGKKGKRFRRKMGMGDMSGFEDLLSKLK